MEDTKKTSLDHLLSDDLAPLFWRPKRTQSPWSGHTQFAHWLIQVVRPRTFVELGTFSGVSYSAFCEAVVRTKCGTQCFSIDTWKGDEHSGFYSEDIFKEFEEFHSSQYSSFSQIIRSTFDEAAPHFPEKWIDILHIDGLHTYESVKHDFENWLNKLSDRAIVLFHDTNERQNDFGVWKLWLELKGRYPSFEFYHSHGLGVLCVGQAAPDEVLALCSLSSTELAVTARDRFEIISRLWTESEQLALVAVELANRKSEIAALEFRAAEWQNQISQKDSRLTEQQNEIAEKDARLAEQKNEIAEKDAKLAEQKNTASLREVEVTNKIAALSLEMQQLRQQADDLNAQLAHERRSLKEMRNSTSWRLTAPLRLVGTAMKSVRKGRK